MKFSIVFLLILTLWIALATQIFFTFTRAKELSQQQIILKQDMRGLEAATKAWQNEHFDRKILDLETDRDQLKTLHQELADAFAAKVSDLSDVIPRDDAVSIREIPVLNRPNLLASTYKVHVPKSRDVSLHVELKPVGEDAKESFADIQWEGERFVKVSLPPGMHLIDYKFMKLEKSAWFAVRLDGEEIARYTYTTYQSGHGYSSPNYHQQSDIRPGKRLPSLLRFNPFPEESEIFIFLSEPKN